MNNFALTKSNPFKLSIYSISDYNLDPGCTQFEVLCKNTSSVRGHITAIYCILAYDHFEIALYKADYETDLM